MMNTTYQEGERGVVYYRDHLMHGGCWYSRERGVEPGTVRQINNIMCKAWSVSKGGIFKKPQILWNPVRPTTLRKIGYEEKPESD